MEVLPGGGGSGAGGTSEQGGDIQVIGAVDAFRVNNDSTITDLMLITAYSKTYGVTFSFYVLKTTFVADGAANLAGLTGGDVDTVCAHPNVQAFRTEQDQDPSGLLYNYGVITVGTPDGAYATDVQQRMDLLNTPATFTLIDNAWAALQKLGAGAAAPVA